MTDIVLINSSNNGKSVDAIGRKGYPLGIGYLSSSLQEAGYQTKMIDQYGRGLTNEETVEKACGLRPAVVGISATSFTLKNAVALAEGIKRQLPETFVVLGGYGPTLEDGFVFQSQDVDIVVRGEGEQTVVELANALRTGGDLRNVQGITYRNGSDVVSNQQRPLIKDLDSLPFPDRSEYSQAIYVPERIEVYGSRGCPHACTFCDISEFYDRRYRRRSPENIMAEVSSLLDEYPNKRVVTFTDDSFLTDGSLLLGVHELIEEKRPPVKISFQARSDDFVRNREVLKKARSSIRNVSMGFESMSQSQLDRWHKGTTVNDNRAAINFVFEEFGPASPDALGVALNFIMADPITTIEELKESAAGLTGYPHLWTRGMIDGQMLYPRVNEQHPKYPVHLRVFLYFMRQFEAKREGAMRRYLGDDCAGPFADIQRFERRRELNGIVREYMTRAIGISESAANKGNVSVKLEADELIRWLDAEIEGVDKVPSFLELFPSEPRYRLGDTEEYEEDYY